MGRKRKVVEEPAEKTVATVIDQPDLRACCIWVMRNLDSDDPKDPPDKVALAIHRQCMADPKFLSTFITSTYSRLMAADEASGQDKFTANNDDLTDLINFSKEHIARARTAVSDGAERPGG